VLHWAEVSLAHGNTIERPIIAWQCPKPLAPDWPF
jgi:hypothetical protein